MTATVSEVLDLQWFAPDTGRGGEGGVGVCCLKFAVIGFTKTLPVLETLGWQQHEWILPPPTTARYLGNGNEDGMHKHKKPANRAVWTGSSLQDVDLQDFDSTAFALITAGLYYVCNQHGCNQHVKAMFIEIYGGHSIAAPPSGSATVSANCNSCVLPANRLR